MSVDCDDSAVLSIHRRPIASQRAPVPFLSVLPALHPIAITLMLSTRMLMMAMSMIVVDSSSLFACERDQLQLGRLPAYLPACLTVFSMFPSTRSEREQNSHIYRENFGVCSISPHIYISCPFRTHVYTNISPDQQLEAGALSPSRCRVSSTFPHSAGQSMPRIFLWLGWMKVIDVRLILHITLYPSRIVTIIVGGGIFWSVREASSYSSNRFVCVCVCVSLSCGPGRGQERTGEDKRRELGGNKLGCACILSPAFPTVRSCLRAQRERERESGGSSSSSSPSSVYLRSAG